MTQNDKLIEEIDALIHQGENAVTNDFYENWITSICAYLDNNFANTATHYVDRIENLRGNFLNSFAIIDLLNTFKGKIILGYIRPDSADQSVTADIKKSKPIIFLSHKSDDKKYGHALREFIHELGVKDDQLIYTSHPSHKIPLDKGIYNYLCLKRFHSVGRLQKLQLRQFVVIFSPK